MPTSTGRGVSTHPSLNPALLRRARPPTTRSQGDSHPPLPHPLSPLSKRSRASRASALSKSHTAPHSATASSCHTQTGGASPIQAIADPATRSSEQVETSRSSSTKRRSKMINRRWRTRRVIALLDRRFRSRERWAPNVYSSLISRSGTLNCLAFRQVEP